MADNSGVEKTSSPPHEMVRNIRALWLSAAVIVLAALIVVILWKVPQLQVEKYVNAETDGKTMDAKDRFNIENEARKTLATILGGIVVLGGVYFTWRNIKLTQKSLKVSQEGQITDRFSKAIEQLGAVNEKGVDQKEKKKLEVRLGGIYALEGIANESKELHWPIMEVLCTYVRVNAQHKRQEPTQKNNVSGDADTLFEPPADIQAILTVLGRRDRKYERERQHLDLSKTDIRGANLIGADLGGASFWDADLRRAYLSDANLVRAYLSDANLVRADLGGANLRGADLSRADLSNARDLTQEQIDGAKGDSTTKLPVNLHMPESWKK